MKIRHLVQILLLSFSLMSLFNCSGDDIKDPNGTNTLNMVREKDGKTLLGNSDVYINNSNNFETHFSYIVDLGKVSGLGADVEPQFENLSREVAVLPNHLYHIYLRKTIYEFPSGNIAALLGSGYYKLYVDAPIVSDNTVTGATVKFVLAQQKEKDLPSSGTLIGNVFYIGDHIEYQLPKGAEVFFDYHLTDGMDRTFDVQFDKGKLTITLLKSVDKVYGPYGEYEMYIRLGSVFTVVTFKVGVSD